MKHGTHLIAASLFSAIVVAGCNPTEAPRPKGQAVVRVNGDDITMHQINYALVRTPRDQTRDRRKIAEQYVEQQLLLQRAKDDKLDRDPEVMQTIEHAKRQIMAQSYLDRAVGIVVPPTKDDVAQYYRAHPELFAERKVYQLQQLTVDKSVPLDELEQKAKTSDAAELTKWLQSKKALVSAQITAQPAEKVALELLPKLHRANRGERIVGDNADGRVVWVLLDAQPTPLSEQQAAPAIGQYLAAEKRDALRHKEISRLRAQAKIEWIDELSDKPDEKTARADGRQSAVTTNR